MLLEFVAVMEFDVVHPMLIIPNPLLSEELVHQKPFGWRQESNQIMCEGDLPYCDYILQPPPTQIG